jgi:hypothetical protein
LAEFEAHPIVADATCHPDPARKVEELGGSDRLVASLAAGGGVEGFADDGFAGLGEPIGFEDEVEVETAEDDDVTGVG